MKKLFGLILALLLTVTSHAEVRRLYSTGLIGTKVIITDGSTVAGQFYNKTLVMGDTYDTPAASSQLDGQFIARRVNNGNAKFRAQGFGTSGGFYALDRARGTPASPTAIQSGDAFGSLVGVGADGSTFTQHGPEVHMYATEDWSSSAHGSSVKILGVVNGTTTQIPLIWAGLGGTADVYIASGNLYVSSPGKTLSIESATAGTSCRGTGTYNGTSNVVISTTCAATGMFVALENTATSGGTASHCYVSAISNNTSFTVKCDAANTATFNWAIIK